MPDHGSAALVARLELIERKQRRLSVACALLAVGLAVSIAWPVLWAPRVVTAGRFVLKDAGGGVRGEWGPTDVLAGEVDGVAQHASKTCLSLSAPPKGRAELCAPWDAPGGPSLVMAEETGAALHIALDAYTVSIIGRTSRAKEGARGRLLLGVHRGVASLSVSDKQGRRTQLLPEGLRVDEGSGQ